MAGSTVGTVTPRPVRLALLAIALDVGALASVAFAPIVGGDFDTDAQAGGYYAFAALVPPLATLAALILSIRSVRAAKQLPAELLAWTAAVFSSILLLLSVTLLLVLAQGTP